MDLSKFVEDCLSEILAGIEAAQKKASGQNIAAAMAGSETKGHLINCGTYGTFTAVDFDVSVVAEDKAGGKAGVRVWSVGAEAGASRASQHTSRVQFTVPVRLPDGDQSRMERERNSFNRSLNYDDEYRVT